MKYFKYSEDAETGTKAKDLIETALRYGGKDGVVYDEMRKRSRIWKAIDENEDPCGLLLEDSDGNILISLLKKVPFVNATRQVEEMITALCNSEAPPAVMETKGKSKGNGKSKPAEEQPAAQA
jgi:hypothetical protein